MRSSRPRRVVNGMRPFSWGEMGSREGTIQRVQARQYRCHGCAAASSMKSGACGPPPLDLVHRHDPFRVTQVTRLGNLQQAARTRAVGFGGGSRTRGQDWKSSLPPHSGPLLNRPERVTRSKKPSGALRGRRTALGGQRRLRLRPRDVREFLRHELLDSYRFSTPAAACPGDFRLHQGRVQAAPTALAPRLLVAHGV